MVAEDEALEMKPELKDARLSKEEVEEAERWSET